MRHRLTVESLATAADSFGQTTKAPTSLGTFWGNVVPLAGVEPVVGNQVRADVTHSITMRRNASVPITPLNLLVFQGRKFNVVEVLDVGERRRELQIKAREIVTPSQ
jgi:SPP1 family predicted phage head-tail adaptor